MASKELKIHRLGLGRLVIEGDLQPIVRFATLTLKDENHDKNIMQLHVDGDTLVSTKVIESMSVSKRFSGTMGPRHVERAEAHRGREVFHHRRAEDASVHIAPI